MKQGLELPLTEGLRELGLEPSQGVVDALSLYIGELCRWSGRINLTGLRSEEAVMHRLVLHSLVLCEFLKGVGSLMDIGSGAGVPGLLLKIVLPELRVVLVESVAKKCHFLRHMVRTLGLEQVEVEQERAESPRLGLRYRGAMDVVVGRAVSDFAHFVELARPFVRTGGRVINLRSPKEAGLLRAEGAECHQRVVPLSGEQTLVAIRRL